MSQTLFVGYNEAYLKAIEGRVATGSVVVLEEPDIIRKRGLADAGARLSCLHGVVPAMYQQADQVVDVGRRLNERRAVDAVVPALEYGVSAAAGLATALGRPGATVRAAEPLRDKARLRRVAARAGIHQPRWCEIQGPQDIVDFAAGGPVVVKPANRQASVGVQLIDLCGPDEAAVAWSALMDVREDEQVPDRPLDWRYMAEQRLQGPEYSVEALVRDGEIVFENVTEKAVIPGLRPVELGHLLPAPLAHPQIDDIAMGMRSLIAAIGFGTGILHAEWILDAGRPALIECAGRCPGDRIVDLIDLAYGTELRLALIDILAGRPPALPGPPRQAAAIRFLTAAPGQVRRVDGVDTARAVRGVEEVHVGVAAGEEARAWESSWDRPGFVIATAPGPLEARTRAISAAETVRIVTA